MNDDQTWHTPWKPEETLSQRNHNRTEIQIVYLSHKYAEHYRYTTCSVRAVIKEKLHEERFHILPGLDVLHIYNSASFRTFLIT
jgi:hypothetical protein